MNAETILKEILTNGHRKINIGVKVIGAVKYQMSQEAIKMGISLSEYCEKILINRNNLSNGNLKTEFNWGKAILLVLGGFTVIAVVLIILEQQNVAKPAATKNDKDKS